MNKKLMIVGILVLCLMGIYVTLRILDIQKQQMIARCIGYDPQWEGVFDCYGYIMISGADDNTGSISDTRNPGGIIAEIRTPEDFYVTNGQLYLINQLSGICGDKPAPSNYCANFRVNGQVKIFYYNSLGQVPKYIVIDTTTGNEKFYVQPQDASSSDQTIFQELITKEST